jgi:two-component system, chemotaxis family, chemotaxis protein CheY
MSEPHHIPGKSILLIEDHEATRMVVRAALQRAGYDVTCPVGRIEVLALIESRPFDLVLTDMVMPEITGIDVIGTVRRLRPTVPIIAMSGGGVRVDIETSLKFATALGANVSVAKPFHLLDLVTAVENALNAGKQP